MESERLEHFTKLLHAKHHKSDYSMQFSQAWLAPLTGLISEIHVFPPIQTAGDKDSL